RRPGAPAPAWRGGPLHPARCQTRTARPPGLPPLLVLQEASSAGQDPVQQSVSRTDVGACRRWRRNLRIRDDRLLVPDEQKDGRWGPYRQASPHRPGTAPALGLRAGGWAYGKAFIAPHTASFGSAVRFCASTVSLIT